MTFVTRIEGGVTWVQGAKGVFRQTDLYHKGETVFIRHSSGFVRVGGKSLEYHVTSHPDLKVLEMDVPSDAGELVIEKFKLTYKANT